MRSEQRNQIVSRMLELQKQFIAYEHKNGLTPEDYYAPKAGHFLESFRKEYAELAEKLVDLAHSEVGSKR